MNVDYDLLNTYSLIFIGVIIGKLIALVELVCMSVLDYIDDFINNKKKKNNSDNT